MKVKESIERDCCMLKDFRALAGTTVIDGKIAESVFCQYCGKRFKFTVGTDADGKAIKEYVSTDDAPSEAPKPLKEVKQRRK